MRLEERVAELETIVARFRQTVAELQEELRKKDRALAAKDERIKELEAGGEEVTRLPRTVGCGTRVQTIPVALATSMPATRPTTCWLSSTSKDI